MANITNVQWGVSASLVHKTLKIRLTGTELNGTTKENLYILRHLEANSQETLADANTHLEEDEALAAFIDETFEEINVSKSDMADFWSSFLDMVNVLMMNVHAIHSCNCDEFLA